MPEEVPDLPLFGEAARELVKRAALDDVLTESELRLLAALHPFSLACTECDADSPATFDEAVQHGWTRICFEDGFGYYFLGLCPDCREDC
jgi:hypothetical protein